MTPATLDQLRAQVLARAATADWAGARALLDPALQDPALPDAPRARLLLDRSQVEARAGRKAAAQRDARAALALDTPHRDSALKLLWREVMAQAGGGWLVPLEAAREMVQLAPGSALAHAYLGEAHLGQGDHARAEAAADRAVQLDPEVPHAHETLLYVRGVLGYRYPQDESPLDALVPAATRAPTGGAPVPLDRGAVADRIGLLLGELATLHGILRAQPRLPHGAILPPLLPAMPPPPEGAGQVPPEPYVEGARQRWIELAWWAWASGQSLPDIRASADHIDPIDEGTRQRVLAEAARRRAHATRRMFLLMGDPASPAEGVEFAWRGRPLATLDLRTTLQLGAELDLVVGVCGWLVGDPTAEALLVSGGGQAAAGGLP